MSVEGEDACAEEEVGEGEGSLVGFCEGWGGGGTHLGRLRGRGGMGLEAGWGEVRGGVELGGRRGCCGCCFDVG